MDSKQLLLAMVLSIAIIVVYEWWMSRYAPPRPPAPTPAVQPQPRVPAGGEAGTPLPGAPPSGQPQAQAPVTGPTGRIPVQDVPGVPYGRGEVVPVRTSTFEARFSTVGAALTELKLLGYRTAPEPGAPPVAIADRPEGALVPTLVPPALAAGAPAGPTPALPPGTVYRVEPAGGLTLAPGQQGSLTFTATTPDGLKVVTRYTFDGDGYAFRIEQTVTNTSSSSVTLQPALVLRHGRDLNDEQVSYHPAGALALTPAGVRRVNFDDLKQPDRIAGPVEWAGWQRKYFAGLILPKGPPAEAVILDQQPAAVAAAGGGSNGAGRAPVPVGQVRLLAPATTVVAGGSTGITAQVYLGPKDVGALRAVDPSLERVIDLGFFQWIAMPLLLLLRWLHGFLGNYGLAIIALTILVKLVFWPLTAKQIKSAKEMQKLQPMIEKLRQKYKDDREAMSREMMELYRRHNVNPLMGCLPIVVQIPVFYALYRVLNDSIELRHAPFYGWITDLSAKDPYYVTPILMGITMLITQKMTPAMGDPTQQKLMLLMPVIFTFFFLGLPSGLVLYWLIQNILQIGQQLYTNRVAR